MKLFSTQLHSSLAVRLSGERCDDHVIQDMFKLSSPAAAAARAVDGEDAPETKIEQPVAVMKRSSGAQNEVSGSKTSYPPDSHRTDCTELLDISPLLDQTSVSRQ